jgi:hypothetical protein
MKHKGMALVSALGLCKRKRPIVNPNPGFMQQLRRYQLDLRKRKLEETVKKLKKDKGKNYKGECGYFGDDKLRKRNEDLGMNLTWFKGKYRKKEELGLPRDYSLKSREYRISEPAGLKALRKTNGKDYMSELRGKGFFQKKEYKGVSLSTEKRSPYLDRSSYQKMNNIGNSVNARGSRKSNKMPFLANSWKPSVDNFSLKNEKIFGNGNRSYMKESLKMKKSLSLMGRKKRGDEVLKYKRMGNSRYKTFFGTKGKFGKKGFFKSRQEFFQDELIKLSKVNNRRNGRGFFY